MRSVLITGATGAIGSAIVPLFLRDPATKVHVVVRARNDDHLAERIHQLAKFNRLSNSSLARLRAYRGDVERRDLGLSSSDYDELRDQVCQVVHVAGNVKLNQPADAARDNATGTLRNVLEFCDRARQFRKLDVASTVGVAGRQCGLITESRVTGADGFHNTYESAKAAAESLLYDAIDSGVPITVHRPSMVIGNSVDGRIIHFQVFYYLCEFLTGRLTAGLVPETGESKLDVIPVDYVARAIQLSSNDPSASGRILHLCSGASESIELTWLADFVRGYWANENRRLPRLRKLQPSTFRRLVGIASHVTPRRLKRSLQTLPFFLDYLGQDQTFDNASSQEYLMPHGLAVPVVKNYLKGVLDYYRSNHGFQKASRSA